MTKEQANYIGNLIENKLDAEYEKLDSKICELDEDSKEFEEMQGKLDAIAWLSNCLSENKNGVEIIPNRYNCNWRVFVAVNTKNGMKYVTETEYHSCKWEDNLPAENFYAEEYARDVVIGLNLNGYQAFIVRMPDYVERVGNYST